MIISLDEAQRYLERNRWHNLPALCALRYDTPQRMYGVRQDGALAALALITADFGARPGYQMTILLAADSPGALTALLAQEQWPPEAVWTATRPDLAPPVERLIGRSRDPQQGLIYYLAEAAPSRPHPWVRQIAAADADRLDLSPCGLSATALRNWVQLGWRVFGAVDRGRLVSHALAGYAVVESEEVASVFTAPSHRGQGLAAAVVAATIADILGRTGAARYVTSRQNLSSQRVAASLDLPLLLETWEIA